MGKESTKHQGSSAARTIAALVISASVLLTGTAYAYAAVTSSGTGGTSESVYGPSLLKGPLTGTSVNAATQTATFSVGGPSQLKGALK